MIRASDVSEQSRIHRRRQVFEAFEIHVCQVHRPTHIEGPPTLPRYRKRIKVLHRSSVDRPIRLVKVTSVLLLVASVLMLVGFVWSWIARGPGARWWARDERDAAAGWVSPAGLAMGALPGMGLFLLGFGLLQMFGDAAIGPASIAMFLGLVWTPIGYFFPRLIAPRWWARQDKEKVRRLKAASRRSRRK